MLVCFRQTLWLSSLLLLATTARAASVVYPAREAGYTQAPAPLSKRPQPTARPCWAKQPEQVVIRSLEDSSKSTVATPTTPLAQKKAPTYDVDDAMEERLFSRHAPAPMETELDDHYSPEESALSFDNPDELLATLSQVFQFDDETLQHLNGLDFNQMLLADESAGTDDEMTAGTEPFASFEQLSDFSRIFAQH